MRRLDWRTLGVGLFVIGLLLIPAWPGRTTGQTHDSSANEGAEGSGTGVGAGWQDRSLVSSEPKTIAQTCLLNCQVTVPTVASPQAEILFQSMVEATGCLGTPTFSWSFGDGSPDKTEQNPRHTYASPGQYQWKLTTHVESGSRTIETIVGGLGEGTNARQATLQEVLQLARDPLGRGVYFVDASTEFSVLRFINTTSEPVTLAGVTIEPQAVRLLAGGGLSISDNIDARQADLALASGLAVSPGGDLVYLINALDGLLRVINVSASPVTVQSNALSPGQIRTLVSGLRQGINGLAVHPTSGLVHYADASPGINRVFRVEPNGTTVPVVGNGQATAVTEGFIPGQATSLPLLLPRALRFDPAGNLFVADTGHGRVIRVDTAGSATLVHQFPVGSQIINAYPSGVAFQGGSVYSANGNQQTITRLAPSAGATIIAGQPGAACDYTGSTCGDGRAMGQAGLYLFNSASSVPLASLDADATGLYLADQGPTLRARIRYLNLSGTSVTLAGVTIPAGAIETIAGNGLAYPFDGGLARSAALSTPVGVSVDPEGNLWIADTLQSLLRFVNRGPEPKTIFPGTSSEQVVPAGVIVTVNPLQTGGQINGPIVQAGFVEPQGLFSTSQGLYLVDSRGGVAVPPGSLSARRTSTLRFLNTGSSVVTFYPGSASPIEVPPGQISRIAGGGDGGKGDGGFALNAVLIGASDVVVAPNGTIYVTDVGQGSVRRIEPATGVISSLALPVAQYTGLGLDTGGRLYIANYEGSNVLRETAVESGTFAPLVGGLIRPRDVAVGSDGTAYVTVSPPTRTSGNHQVVAVSSAGVVTRVAGEQPGFRGDGGDATTAQIRIVPSDLVVGSGTSNQLPKTVNITFGVAGELVFTDSNNQRIRQLLPATLVCERTGTIEVTTQNPVPTVSALSPATAAQNSGALTLTVTGTNFLSGAVVRWNGQDRVTTYQGPTELRAQLLATDLATAGVVPVTVFHPAPGGGVSAALNFTVSTVNPVPMVSALSPTAAVQNSGALTLTVTGTNFVSGAVVRWNGQDRVTTYQGPTELRAQLLATDLVTAGVVPVTVFHPAPGGGVSAALNFTVSTVNPVPMVSALSPTAAAQNSGALTLTVTGTNFVSGAVVRWNGQDRVTTYQGPTELRAQLLVADLATAGVVPVTVFHPAPGGGVSTALNFTVTAVSLSPVPVVSAITPTTAVQNGDPFTLTVIGSQFVAGAVVRWNGQDRPTTFLNSTVLQAAISSTDLAVVGTASVTVFHPAPGGGTSTALSFQVLPPNPIPQITLLNPSSTPQGSPGLTLTVGGGGFVNGSEVRWGGQPRPTIFLSNNQLTVTIPASDFAVAGNVSVTVFNPSPGGGISNTLRFTVEPIAPTLTTLDRVRVGVGGEAFSLLLTGAGFNSTTIAYVDSQARETTYVGPTELRVQILPADLLTKGTRIVAVANQGVSSNGVPLLVMDRVTSVLATSYDGQAAAPNSILSAFAPRLADGQVVVTALPLPRTLSGTRLVVEDQQGVSRDQELFFVAPGQINYLLDPQTAPGPARVSVFIGQEIVAVGDLLVEPAAPGLFTQNATGEGVPAGYALRFHEGASTFVPILTYDSGALRWQPVEIDLGSADDLIVLVLFGSGFRDVTGPVTARLVKGQQQFPAEVLYAGLTEQFVGLDQLNLLLPRQAVGAGEVRLVLEAAGKTFNAGRDLILRIK